MMLTVRPMTEADAPAMAQILNDIIAIGGTTAFEDPLTPAQICDKCLNDPALVSSFVAVDSEGNISGFQYLVHISGLADDVASIATFARGANPARGTGTALMARTKDAARAAGLRMIEAKIRADNLSGLAFYTKMGAVDHDVEKGVPLKDGTPVDRIVKNIML